MWIKQKQFLLVWIKHKALLLVLIKHFFCVNKTNTKHSFCVNKTQNILSIKHKTFLVVWIKHKTFIFIWIKHKIHLFCVSKTKTFLKTHLLYFVYGSRYARESLPFGTHIFQRWIDSWKHPWKIYVVPPDSFSQRFPSLHWFRAKGSKKPSDNNKNVAAQKSEKKVSEPSLRKINGQTTSRKPVGTDKDWTKGLHRSYREYQHPSSTNAESTITPEQASTEEVISTCRELNIVALFKKPKEI